MSGVRLRQLAIAATVLAYALLVHYSNLGTAPPALGAVLAVAPVPVVLAMWLWRARWRWATVPLALGVTAALLWTWWGPIERYFRWLYLWQQCAAYAALALAFGRTLLPGQVPLCTYWATLVHGVLPEVARRYTRAVTAMWTAFFVLVVAVSLALYLFAARTTWSLFSNFLILPLSVLLFAAEYALRRHWLPDMRRATLAEMLQLCAAESPPVTDGSRPRA